MVDAVVVLPFSLWFLLTLVSFIIIILSHLVSVVLYLASPFNLPFY